MAEASPKVIKLYQVAVLHESCSEVPSFPNVTLTPLWGSGGGMAYALVSTLGGEV